jgi:hypothetical protein
VFVTVDTVFVTELVSEDDEEADPVVGVDVGVFVAPVALLTNPVVVSTTLGSRPLAAAPCERTRPANSPIAKAVPTT